MCPAHKHRVCTLQCICYHRYNILRISTRHRYLWLVDWATAKLGGCALGGLALTPPGWFPCDNWGGRPNNWGVEPPNLPPPPATITLRWSLCEQCGGNEHCKREWRCDASIPPALLAQASAARCWCIWSIQQVCKFSRLKSTAFTFNNTTRHYVIKNAFVHAQKLEAGTPLHCQFKYDCCYYLPLLLSAPVSPTRMWASSLKWNSWCVEP